MALQPMSMLNPIAFATSMLVSTTATESVALWEIGTPYVVGDQRRLDTTHKIYECLIDNTGYSPDVNLDGATPKWQEVGATNGFAAFDSKWGTQTTATNTLTIVIAPGAIGALALLNLEGANVEIVSRVDGSIITSHSIPIQSTTGVYDLLQYFIAPIVAPDDIVVTDLLPYGTQEITITITGPGTVAIGNISFGSIIDLGLLQYGVKVGIIDWSKKDTDLFGNYIIVERAYSKRFSGTLEVDNTFIDQLTGILASVRATPVVFIGLGTTYSCLIVLGFISEWEVDVTYPTKSYCSFSIKGLT